MADTTILIENPDVVRDIQNLAVRIGKSPAEAVAYAVREALAELDASHRADASSTGDNMEDGLP